MKIIINASKDPYLKNHLRIIINDKDKANYESLVAGLEKLHCGEEFKNKPIITNDEVNLVMAKRLCKVDFVPTFCFIDPYGYKGLTKDLIRAVIKDYGCDCLVFFHTSGINRNIVQDCCLPDLHALFGEDGYRNVIQNFGRKRSSRETVIMEEFCRICCSVGAKIAFPFRFDRAKSKRKSHHLIFLTKHIKGFKIMKGIMAQYSIKQQGIPIYVYHEGWDESMDQPHLMSLGPMDILQTRLLTDFRGKQVAVGEIMDCYDEKGLGYTEQNVKKALEFLEMDGKIVVVEKPGRKRPAGTFANDRVIDFREGVG